MTTPVKGVTFDVDGTLYAPSAIAFRMLVKTFGKWRVLRVGRAVREELRGRSFDSGDAFRAEEAKVAGERLDVTPEHARQLIDDVYDRALTACLKNAPAVHAQIARVVDNGIAVGAVSDRRIDDKLTALGLADLPWRTRVNADDTGILKPDPRVFSLACEGLGVAPAEAVHVGDRDDTDGKGSRSAGMAFVLVDGPEDLSRAIDQILQRS